ncbi:MAG: acylneuraminate cytidylyltransferase [Sphingomonadales bacterium BRH_c3]|nr:MAG: acylneuraminate cytidylyltransferase [Sphingomonadales bacterium BRH_c3]
MKAHSARVSGKNFKVLGNKPLFRWILDTLLSIGEIEQVVINTDARDVLLENGLDDGYGFGRVLIRDRKPELCGDFVPMNDIISDDINAIDAEAYLMTHTTNPFLSSATISAALQAYRQALANGDADSLFSVNKIQTRFYRGDGSAINHDPKVLLRTQDLEPWFEENSNLYIFNRDSFDSTDARIGAWPLMYETPALESMDIDTPAQWELASALAAYRIKSEMPS